MALLDELKKQADLVLVQQEQERNRQLQREAFYQSHIKPKMQMIMAFLQEMTQHLNVINAGVEINYEMLGLGSVPVKHSAYQFKFDHVDEPRCISIQFHYASDKEYHFDLQGHEKIQAQIDFFCKYNLRHKSNYRKNEQHHITHAAFKCQPKIHAYAEVAADIDTGMIRFTFNNINQFERILYSCAPESVNDEMLDEYGKYLLGKENMFLQTRMTEKEKASIRKKLSQQRLQEQLARQQEAIRQQQKLLEQQFQEANPLKTTFKKIGQLFKREG